MSNDTDHVAHNNTVRKILESSHATWKSLLELQATDNMNPDGIFLDPEVHANRHPQKRAHSQLIGYHQLIANKTYTIKADDLWREELQQENGDVYEVEVPENGEVQVDDEVSLETIETKKEAISLETLHHRWGMRYIDVVQYVESSWGGRQTEHYQRRVWLPPKAIALAFEQLEEVRSKVNLAADVDADDWKGHKVLNASGVRDPKNVEQRDRT